LQHALLPRADSREFGAPGKQQEACDADQADAGSEMNPAGEGP
jgi:hypothetical protein